MSQFMLVMLEQFTVTLGLEQRFQASTNRLAVNDSYIENNHELQIIADFIVII